MLNFVVACLTIIAGAIPGPQAGNGTAAQVYGSEAPYGNVASSEVVEPPKGYSLFFVETVGRHGSRTSVPSDVSGAHPQAVGAGQEGERSSPRPVRT